MSPRNRPAAYKPGAPGRRPSGRRRSRSRGALRTLRPEPAPAYTLVTIEASPSRRNRDRWEATLWTDELTRVGSAHGSSPQHALVNALLTTVMEPELARAPAESAEEPRYA